MKRTKTNSILKPIKILFFLLVFTLAYQSSFGQMLNGTIFQPMRILGESGTHLDISSAIVRCDSVNQIHLKIVNENNIAQDAVFSLFITNTDTGDHFSQAVTVPNLAPLKATEADCSGNPQLANLIINLPSSYNPGKTIMHIIF